MFCVIKSLRPKGREDVIFFNSRLYCEGQNLEAQTNRTAPRAIKRDGRCYAFLTALMRAVCFVIIFSLGFCKLLLQLDIFSYNPQNLLGNCNLFTARVCASSLTWYFQVLVSHTLVSFYVSFMVSWHYVHAGT